MTSATSTPDTPVDPRAPRRVRHELRFRVLEVQRVQRITPHLVRITLHGDELEGFASPGFDDHVKLFFPDPATGALRAPRLSPEGPVWDGGRPVMRDYTPRHHDAAARTLDIDFALHDAGPATEWALRAKAGDRLGVGGPRGSFILSTDFDGHLLVGDDTALPAIARRLAELPPGSHAVVVAEVDSPEDEVPFDTGADLRVHWVHRRGAPAGTGTGLVDALRAAELPAGDVYAWVGCESGIAKAARVHLMGERGVPPRRIKAAGYWRLGSAATHDKIED